VTKSKIVFYSATWCQQCPGVFTKVERLAAKYPEVELEKVVTDSPEADGKVPLDLMGVPAVDLYKDGQLLGRLLKEAVTPAAIKTYLDLD